MTQPFGRPAVARSPSPVQESRPSCPSCGGEILGAFCHACGQSAKVANNVGELAHDAVTRFFNVDSGTIRGLWRLVVEPGALAADWMRGKRVGTLTPWQTAALAFSLMVVAPTSGIWLMDRVHELQHVVVGEADQEALKFFRDWTRSFALAIAPLNYFALRLVFGRRNAEEGYRHLVVSLYQLGSFMLVVGATILLTYLKFSWLGLYVVASNAAMLRQTVVMLRDAYGTSLVGAIWRALVVLFIDLVGFLFVNMIVAQNGGF